MITPHTLTVDGTPVTYRVRRSQRAKRLRLVVKPGLVEAVAPVRFDERVIHEFVAAKGRWVVKKRAELEERAGERVTRRYVSGTTVAYRGRQMPLRVTVGGAGEGPAAPELTVREAEGFFVRLPEGMAEEEREDATGRLVRRWLEAKALEDAWALCHAHAPTLGVTPKDVKIGNQKTLWGSCAADGTLRLNWRLVTAPRPVFEYVVVHELAHLLERNHGPRFWGHVARVLPEYESQRRWLRRHGVSLG